MKHRPHLLVPEPWNRTSLRVPDQAERHMSRVLRYPDDEEVTYTNGKGIQGIGIWSSGAISRGEERQVPPASPAVTLAVAPPKAKERQRFIVEKAQELGVARLLWLDADHRESRPIRLDKALGWAVSALEQSRGAHLIVIEDGGSVDAIPEAILLDADASQSLQAVPGVSQITIAVGPEGGFSERERSLLSHRAVVSSNVLRTETAAIVAAAIVLAV